MRRSTNKASREVSVKQIASQPDRLRQQGMTRQQPKSQPPASGSWYRPKMEQQGSSNNTQNTWFWLRRRSTTDGKQEPHVVCRDRARVLEFNINTFHHMTTRCCLAQLGLLSCIPTYRENCACPTHFNTWFNIEFYSLRSEKEQERKRKTGDFNRLSIHHRRCSAIRDSPKQLLVGFRKHTLGGPRNEARKESREKHRTKTKRIKRNYCV